MGQLDGRVALVTGGSSGIGRAAAMIFAREGASVLVADVDKKAEETARLISGDGGKAKFIETDVSNSEQVKRAVQEAVSSFGGLYCAFNNAGIGGATAPTGDCDEGDWNKVLAINLTGVMLCMKHEIAAMQNNGGGVIVNNASILGHVGFPNAPAYVASKHGVMGLTKAAALEYAQQGIRVNALCPGFIATPMLERAGMMQDRDVLHSIEQRHAMNRLGRPEEVAETAVFLCTDAASFMTGHGLLVDGGYVAQ